MNRDVEQLRAVAQPVLRDQQMPGTGNGQELGDAFDDAEIDRVQDVGHKDPRWPLRPVMLALCGVGLLDLERPPQILQRETE